jgi:hypothetical protein
MALLLNLSYNILKQAQINTVFVQQEKADRVGFEPTTLASLAKGCSFCLLSSNYQDDIIIFITNFSKYHLEYL